MSHPHYRSAVPNDPEVNPFNDSRIGNQPRSRLQTCLARPGIRFAFISIALWACWAFYVWRFKKSTEPDDPDVKPVPDGPDGPPSSSTKNMNGLYKIANPPKNSLQKSLQNSLQKSLKPSVSVDFNTDYASRGHEYFDLYSQEIATKYGEVFWTDLPDMDLPAEIVKRFENSAIAITGYEHDQVIIQGGPPGTRPDLDVSVPFGWAYNHHFLWFMTGADAEMKTFYIPKDISFYSDGEADGNAGRGNQLDAIDIRLKPALEKLGMRSFHDGHMAKPFNTTHLEITVPVPVLKSSDDNSNNKSYVVKDDETIPSSTYFSEANGGESRMSFHGYPKGTAQIVNKPRKWHANPMQVDTRNRDCGIEIEHILYPEKNTKCPNPDPKTGEYRYWPGPEPKQARWPGNKIPLDKFEELTGKKAPSSALSECPCNSRFGGDPIVYGEDTKTKLLADRMVGMITKAEMDGRGQCKSPVKTDEMCFESAGKMLEQMESGEGSGGSSDSITKLIVKNITADVGSLEFPIGCSVRFEAGESEEGKQQQVSVIFNPPTSEMNQEQHGGQHHDENSQQQPCSTSTNLARHGSVHFKMIKDPSLKVDLTVSVAEDHSVKIEMSGPSDLWFGVAFGAHYMADKPYAVIVEGEDQGGLVQERRLGTCGDEAGHCPGDKLEPSLIVVSNKIDGNGMRKVVLTASAGWEAPFGSDVVSVSSGGDNDNNDKSKNDKSSSNMEKKVESKLESKLTSYFSFAEQTEIPMLSAVGSAAKFAYHASHNKQILYLWSSAPTATKSAPTATSGDSKPDTKSYNCICLVGSNGETCDYNGKNCAAFERDPALESCPADGSIPASGQCSSIKKDKNPTLIPRTYAGGLVCCGPVGGKMARLLDVGQETVEMDKQILRYRMKFRVWFEEYRPATTSISTVDTSSDGNNKLVQKIPASHVDLPRLFWQTEGGAGEHDVPPAFRRYEEYPIVGYPDWPMNKPTPGTKCEGDCPNRKDCKCWFEMVYKYRAAHPHPILATSNDKKNDKNDKNKDKLKGNKDKPKGFRLIMANGHCHAPNCRSLELFYKDLRTNEWNLLCENYPELGSYPNVNDANNVKDYVKDDVKDDKLKKNDLTDKLTEPGYVTIPPCIWSASMDKEEAAQEGLEPSVHIRAGQEMMIIKKSWNTWTGTYGEMGFWQMRGIAPMEDYEGDDDGDDYGDNNGDDNAKKGEEGSVGGAVVGSGHVGDGTKDGSKNGIVDNEKDDKKTDDDVSESLIGGEVGV